MDMGTLSFRAKLFRESTNSGSWTFLEVPKQFAPPYTLHFGRTPVHATVEGKSWDTSVWTEKSGRIVLPVPKKIRGSKEDGDVVSVTLIYVS